MQLTWLIQGCQRPVPPAKRALEGPGQVIRPESVLRGSRAGLAVAGLFGGLPGPRLRALPARLSKLAAFE